MIGLRTQQAHLFEPQPPAAGVPEPQRAAAIELLKALLTEALRSTIVQDSPATGPEADHDEDHA